MSSDKKEVDLSASGLFKSDAKLKDVAFDKYSKAASDDDIAAVKAAFEKIGTKVSVFDDAASATKYVSGLVPKDASVGFGGSTTLSQVGVTDAFKARTDLTNLKELALAEKDQAKAASYRAQAAVADYFISSVDAVSATADLLACDLTGTRTGGFLGAKHLIVVAGTNKIVPDEAAALKRQKEYSIPMESARVRIAYAAMGVQASAGNFVVKISGNNPWGVKNRVEVVLIKGSYGF